jgi:hypothetical protein
MPAINATDLTLILSVLSFFGVVFGVYSYFRNPQISADKMILTLQENYATLQKQVVEIKETHLKAAENDIKVLTTAVNDLSKTVIRLSTIIDERIPRQNPPK